VLPPVAMAQQPLGVAVRGHWVLEVRDPDGSLKTRREFDNALTTLGANLLQHLLSAAPDAVEQSQPDGWLIRLKGTDGGFHTSPFIEHKIGHAGWIVPVGENWENPGGGYGNIDGGIVFDTLTVEPGLVIKATATAERTGFIGEVSTMLRTRTRYADGQGGFAWTRRQGPHYGVTDSSAFSRTTIAPLELEAGQILQLTVQISFQAAPHGSNQ
jgi:hypothetical protein